MMKVLISFSRTYLCVAGFPAMTARKTKHCKGQADNEGHMRFDLSNISRALNVLIAPVSINPHVDLVDRLLIVLTSLTSIYH